MNSPDYVCFTFFELEPVKYLTTRGIFSEQHVKTLGAMVAHDLSSHLATVDWKQLVRRL
jgi:hypothetical protein